ncbi:cip1-interacting zinc finger protein-like [Polypterus senegalus]|uniref:cip1-interacting zinc finger protein-like n=1 Tax=Polypterus senegalus TaxID=55291 RepID=UPI0019625F17|nr:cip1-interacting zinc finger protein-like [Polypterus senegalus]XP_039618599.1 cip1-interacting zinc finger protein-like [Polypterus senegalus]
MFNQQQLQQHLRQIQQLFQQQQQQQQQQQPQPSAPPPPPQPPAPQQHRTLQHHHQGGRGLQPQPAPPPSRLLNLCPASRAALLTANPMLQGALLMQQMQGNLRGFAMSPQQFFPPGARPSLLGPAPMGVALKTPRMPFSNRPYLPQSRTFNKDFVRVPDRKREMEQRPSASIGDVQKEHSVTNELIKKNSSRDDAVNPECQTECSEGSQDEPAPKKQKQESSEDQTAEEIDCDEQKNQCASSKTSRSNEQGESTECTATEEASSMDGAEASEFAEESRASEVLSAGGSLKVTIQQSSESRAISTSTLEGATRNNEKTSCDTDSELPSKFYCYICNITCYNQQNFQTHMNGLAHQQRMMEIQHMSNACLVTLLPKVKESLQGQSQVRRDGEKRQTIQRWCSTCQIYFTGDIIEHRRTKEHKLSKHSSRPFCTVCKRHVRTPRKFVEHMKSAEHKQRVLELRTDSHGIPENPEDLITVDAIGCFEGEEYCEEDPSEEDDDDETFETETQQESTQVPKEVTLEDMNENTQYNSETQYGSSFVIPVAGFLCRLCHKFYHFESAARVSHCKSLAHFEHLQKYRASRQREEPINKDPVTRLGKPHECYCEEADKKQQSVLAGSETDISQNKEVQDCDGVNSDNIVLTRAESKLLDHTNAIPNDLNKQSGDNNATTPDNHVKDPKDDVLDLQNVATLSSPTEGRTDTECCSTEKVKEDQKETDCGAQQCTDSPVAKRPVEENANKDCTVAKEMATAQLDAEPASIESKEATESLEPLSENKEAEDEKETVTAGRSRGAVQPAQRKRSAWTARKTR